MQALVQSLRQENDQLTLVNTRLLRTCDEHANHIERLKVVNNEQALSASAAQKERRRHSYDNKENRGRQEERGRIQSLERTVNFLEAQNLNLSLVHDQMAEAKKQNERLQIRLRESKTKTQIKAYESLDTKET